MRGLRAVDGPRLIDVRLAGGRPVMGVCVGMQVLFDGSAEPSVGGPERGMGEWPGVVERLRRRLFRTWDGRGSKPRPAPDCLLWVEDELSLVHSYAALTWALEPEGSMATMGPKVSWSEHGARFVAVVENGPLVATQFHPEKSGDAGAHLFEHWVATL